MKISKILNKINYIVNKKSSLPMHNSKTHLQLLSCNKSWHFNLILQRNKTTEPKILLEENLAKDPFCVFYDWWQQALKQDSFAANIGPLATVDCEGKPANRIMTLKAVNAEGFIIGTKIGSRKANHMAENSNVALLFHWNSFRRYVEIQGFAEKMSMQQNELFFRKKPRDLQILHSMPHISAVPSRSYLEELVQQFKSKLKEDEPVPLLNWACYIIIPHTMEFWQGRHYLYDRIRFRRGENIEKEVDAKCVHQGENGWIYERLSP